MAGTKHMTDTGHMTHRRAESSCTKMLILSLVLVLCGLASGCRSVNLGAATTAEPTAQPDQTEPQQPTPSSTFAADPGTTPEPVLASTELVEPPIRLDQVDFRNDVAYDLGQHGLIEVTDGSRVAEGTANDYVSLNVEDVQLGDLDGDGSAEAAVSIRYRTGGSGQFSHVQVFSLIDGEVVQVAVTPLGDRGHGGVIAARIDRAALIVDTYGGDGPACCPTLAIQDRYELIDGALTGQGEPLTRAWVPPATVGDQAQEIRFLPGTATALTAVYQSADHAGQAQYSFEAAAGQHLTVDKIRGAGLGGDIELRVATTSELIAAGQQLDVFLPDNSTYLVSTTPSAEGTVILEVAIAGPAVFVSDESEREPQVEHHEVSHDFGEPVPGEPTWETEEAVTTWGEEAVAVSKLTWPVLTSTSARAGLEVTNDNIAEYVAALDDLWTSNFAATKGSPGGESVFELDYEVTLAAPELLSIRFDFYQYQCCQAYPTLGHRAIVVDLNTGNVLALGQFLNEARIDALGTKLVDALIVDYEVPAQNRSYVVDGLEYLVWDAVALRSDGIEIGTDRGELLASAYPPTITILSWQELGDIVWPGVVSDAVIGRTLSTATAGLDG